MKRIIFVLLLTLGIISQGVSLWADDDAIMDVDNTQYSAIAGSWTTSSWAPCAIGGAYYYARGSDDSITVQTVQTADITGPYAVYARWTSATNRNNNAIYQISDGNTVRDTTARDQRYNGCNWQYLSTVTLTAGNKGKVFLCNMGATASEVTVADGIRFVRVSKDNNDITNEAGCDYEFLNISTGLEPTDEVVDTISITAPSSGRVIVNASGYFYFASSGSVDCARCSITTGTTLDFAHLIIAEERSVAAMKHVPFAGTRGYFVSKGTTTFRLVCDECGGDPRIGDPNLTAIFVPTLY